MNIYLRRIRNALIMRMPLRLRRHLLLCEARRIQRRKDQTYRLDESDRSCLLSCDSMPKLFRFAKDRFDIVQREEEIGGLIGLLGDMAPVLACEIGTHRCGNLFLLTHCLKTLQRVVAIDMCFQQRAMYEAMRPRGLEVHFIEERSTSRRALKALQGFLRGDKLDFLFIDGDHSYQGCKEDFALYREFVRDGGLIAFHDIVPDLTTKRGSPVALSKAYAGGVPLVWAEVKERYKSWEFVDDWEQDGFGIGAIEYSGGSASCAL